MSAVIDEAGRLDAAGDHDGAVNVLARATSSGDLDAMTELGRRLVVGNNAPVLPREGAGFLAEAASKGHPEAPLSLSVLAATGVECEQSWRRALELVVVAAERGSRYAQSQLVTLAGDARPQAPAGEAARWRQLAGAVDLAEWSKAPPAKTLHEEPLVRAFEQFASERVCAWLIGRCHGKLQRALVYNAVDREDFEDESRTNTAASFDLMNADLVQLLVQQRMSACCGVALYNMEAMSILHYDVGEEIRNHFDFVNPEIPNYAQELADNGQRIITFLVYLNEDYEGGETVFPELGVTHKGRRGEGLFFVNALANREPDRRVVHAGRPPQSGEKWVVSQFIRDRELLRRGQQRGGTLGS